MSYHYYYILEGDCPIEVSITEWGRWFETADRTIAVTKIGDAVVSTVFLSLNHRFGPGAPLLFETLIFGGDLDREMERYETAEAARTGHEQMVARVQCVQVATIIAASCQ